MRTPPTPPRRRERPALALAALTAALLAAGCARDLELPGRDRLQAAPERPVVAPRQATRIVASGGSGGYAYAFAPNGKLSGPDATVDAATGAYVAGRTGSAQDVLAVTDSTGVTVEVRVTVGAPLAITPPVSAVAPGAVVGFTATGGQPPYAFRLVPGERSASTLEGATYTASAVGGVVDALEVTDATGDPAARAAATVSVGGALAIYPSAIRVAPREALVLTAVGGQPPYAFALASAGSGGAGAAVQPAVDAATGAYAAGSNDLSSGDKTDTVVVTDRNGMTATATIAVGEPLTLSVLQTTVRPGRAVTLTATGGKPPYRFAFQERGNRSRGTVEPTTGTYVPGRNTSVQDLLQVTDAAGATARLASPLTVGPYQFEAPGGFGVVVAADLEGDGTGDLVLSWSGRDVVTARRFWEGPALQYGAFPADAGCTLYAAAGRWQGRTGMLAGCGERLLPLQADLQGAFVAQPWIGVGGAWSDVRGVALANSYVLQQDGGAPAGGCPQGGIVEVSADSGALTCRFDGVAALLSALSAGYYDASGDLGLAWVVAGAGASLAASGPLSVHYLSSGATVRRSAEVPFPAGRQLIMPASGVGRRGASQLLDEAMASPGAASHLAFLVLHDPATGAGELWSVDMAAPAQAFPPYPLPTVFTAVGIASYLDEAGVPIVAAWDQRSGRVPIVRVDPATGPAPGSAPVELGYPVQAATFADLNMDGAPDLVTVGRTTSLSDVVWGDGDGGFGRRARFGSLDEFYYAPAPLADVDGDGRTDLVTVSVNPPALEVFWGTGAQLAVGPRTLLPASPSSYAVGDFTGRGAVDVVYEAKEGGLFLAAGSATGAFAPPAPIVTPEGGQDLAFLYDLRPARLGGTGPGPDLLGWQYLPGSVFPTAVAVIRTDATHARRVVLPELGRCAFGAADRDGDGRGDVVALCRERVAANSFVFTVRVARNAGTAVAPSFEPWGAAVEVSQSTRSSSPVALGAQDGSARFLVNSDEGTGTVVARIVTVGAGGVTKASLDAAVAGVAFGRVLPAPAGAPLDLVAATGSELRVYSGGEGGWTFRQRLGARGATFVGVVAPAAGAPGHVLVGDTSELVMVTNDGAGQLR